MASRLKSALIAAGAAALTIVAADFAAASRIVRHVNHQFQQVRLPTGAPGVFRVGMWVFNPGNGRIRLCVLGNGSEEAVMSCSPWTGEGPAGRYRLQQMYPTRRPGAMRSGIWILNYQTGTARACLIGDLANPVGSLKCSPTR